MIGETSNIKITFGGGGKVNPSRVNFMYRVTQVVANLGWVDFLLVIPLSAWFKLGQMVILKNLSQFNPGLRPPESPCIVR